jgi:hypothetical protein
MALFVKAGSFLRNLFLSRRVDADLDQEVLSHLEMLTDENIGAGMSQKEAERAARIELGGIEQVKEQVREERIGNWFRSVISDCRYGVRQLRKNPGATAIMVFTLALAIGASTAIFSAVYGESRTRTSTTSVIKTVVSRRLRSMLTTSPPFPVLRSRRARTLQASHLIFSRSSAFSRSSGETSAQATPRKGPPRSFLPGMDTGSSILDRRRTFRGRT